MRAFYIATYAASSVGNAALEPGGDWDGTAASGFASTPTDPTRTTAKPAMRLLEPPNQYFTDTLTVGVMAFANNDGTLIGGVEKVRFHFEGNTVDVLQPSFRSLTHADGTPYNCLGYWVTLKKPSGTAGHANLYAEAFPGDGTMQNRVIGPYQFSPVATLHDYSVTVRASVAESAGVNYQTVGAAMRYMETVSAENGLIDILETGSEDLTTTNTTVAAIIGEGYLTIRASVPYTFARASYTDDTAARIATKWNRVKFDGVTFDMQFITDLDKPGGAVGTAGEYWFNRCTFTNTGGRYLPWRKGVRPVSFLAEGEPYFTECTFNEVQDCVNQALLARGCYATDCYNDFSGDARCLVYNKIDEFESLKDWASDISALTVTYTGSETTATFAATGTNPKTFTATYGATTATFEVGRTEAYYTGASGDGYSVQDVADWLNGLTGWTATVLDDTRYAQALTLPATNNTGFTAQNVKNVTLSLVTFFDLHGDIFQHRFGAFDDNYIIAFNSGFNMRGQGIFISGDGAMRDCAVVGNAFAHKNTAPPGTGFYHTSWDAFESVMGRTDHLHVFWAHNSFSRQTMRVDTASGADPDAYSLIANNAFRNLYWDGTPDADIVIADNVIDSGNTAPSGATGTVIGGDETSKFVDSQAGDLTPAGELLANPKTAIATYDLNGETFAASGPVGALTA